VLWSWEVIYGVELGAQGRTGGGGGLIEVICHATRLFKAKS